MRKSVENAFDQNGDLRPDDVFDNDALAVDDLVGGVTMSMIMEFLLSWLSDDASSSIIIIESNS